MTEGTAPPPRDGTVFISYARADDETPPMPNAPSGWVTFFWDQLRWELTDRGAKRAKLWLDRYQIDPDEAFTPAIERAVREARLIVPVLSRNWADSEWCRREVETFGTSHPDAVERIIPVIKNEPSRDALPELLRGDKAKTGHRFFVKEPSGKVREFYWRGLQDEKAYYDVVKEIAESIVRRLGEKLSPPPAAPWNGRTVYVAVAAQELRDARQRLVNDLTAAGFAVVPEGGELPDTAEECAEAVREALARAELAVHILGENPGMTPGGGSAPILRLQLDLARKAAAKRALPRVLWAPRWLPTRPEAKRDPFEVASRLGDGPPRAGEEIYGEEVTDLSQWLRRRLEPPPPPDPGAAPAATCLLVASADPGDDEDAADLANRVQGAVARVQPVFADEAVPDLGGASAAVVVPWRTAARSALDALLARLPAGAPVACLRLPGGDEAAKRRFFKEGVYVEKLEALPPDKRTARELLDRLEILAGAGR